MSSDFTASAYIMLLRLSQITAGFIEAFATNHAYLKMSSIHLWSVSMCLLRCVEGGDDTRADRPVVRRRRAVSEILGQGRRQFQASGPARHGTAP